MVPKLLFSQACEGFIHYKSAVGKSPHTISDYRVTFKKLEQFLKDDPPFAGITRQRLISFFAWLQNDYMAEPDGAAPRGKKKLSQKSILNIHTNLSSLWTWGVKEGYVNENLVRKIDPPKVNTPVIEPFTKDEVEKLLKACQRAKTWKNRTTTANFRPTAERDRAIILLLLDTGIRATELCLIQFMDLDMDKSRVKARGKGPGKEEKERFVFFGKRTAQALWKYLLPLPKEDCRPEDFVFTVGLEGDKRPMTRGVLLKLLQRIGERGGVRDVHPHRFRHCFAILYLRNKGNIFTLQSLLGHTTLEMVHRYLKIAEIDLEEGHRDAGPVDHWRL